MRENSLRALVGKSYGEGSDGQVVTLGQETVLIGSPGQSDILTLGRDVVDGTFVGVSLAGFVTVLSVTTATAGADLFLGVGFITGGTVRTRVSAIQI